MKREETREKRRENAGRSPMMVSEPNGFMRLLAWQKARRLHERVRELSDKPQFAREYELKRQMQGSALSIPSNICEGYGRGGRGEFHQFLIVAKGSCGELRSQIISSLDAGLIAKEEAETFVCEIDEVARIIEGLRKKVLQQKGNSLDTRKGVPKDAS